MAKKSASSRDAPERPDERKGGFERAARPMLSRASRKATMDEVVSRLSGLGRGWDIEAQQLLRLPDILYENSNGSVQYYSGNLDYGISSVVTNLMNGAEPHPSKGDYGIALYETADSIYFVFVDMRRRIVVRERLMSYQGSPAEQSWQNIKDAIKSAMSLADSSEAKKAGSVAISDGTVRLLKAKEPSEEPFDPRVPDIPEDVYKKSG